MKKPIVLVGLGEMGGVFARALLRHGHPVVPVGRAASPDAVAGQYPVPELVLIATGENDLADVLRGLPATWRDRLGLLQNELLPTDWTTHGIEDPTVISVWFEKKRGRDAKVLLPSPVHGPGSRLLTDALATIGIPAREVTSADDMLFELVLKNVYILTTNIAGLETGGTVSELWNQHRELARAVAGDVISIQAALTGTALDSERLLRGMQAAFDGDPDHKCMGRSAPDRLRRALAVADDGNLPVPTIRDIGARHLPSTPERNPR